MESKDAGQEKKRKQPENFSSLGQKLYHLDCELSQPGRFRSHHSQQETTEKVSSTRYFTAAKVLLVLLFILVGVIAVNYFGLFSGLSSLENKLTGTTILSDGMGTSYLSKTWLNLSSELFLVISFVIIAALSLYNLNTYLETKTKLKNRIKIN